MNIKIISNLNNTEKNKVILNEQPLKYVQSVHFDLSVKSQIPKIMLEVIPEQTEILNENGEIYFKIEDRKFKVIEEK